MKTKTGIIMDINKNKVTLMTQSGEFIDVKRNKLILEIGSIYTGEIYTKLPLRKLIATAAVFIFFIFGSAEAYAYYTPTSTFFIGGAADIEIKINKWNKIISVNGLNNEGKEILEETHVKHTSIDNGLQKILETTKRTLENRANNEDLTLTIKDSNGNSNEANLKNKIDLADLPINIEVVTSHTEENTQNENSENNNSKNSDSKGDNNKPDNIDKDNKNIKHNANNKQSNESNNNIHNKQSNESNNNNIHNKQSNESNNNIHNNKPMDKENNNSDKNKKVEDDGNSISKEKKNKDKDAIKSSNKGKNIDKYNISEKKKKQWLFYK